MQEGCELHFTLKQIEALGVSEKLTNIFKKTNEQFLVAANKRIKYCPTPDCDSLLHKPCCCRNRAMCAVCAKPSCFKCGKEWHKGKC